MLTVNLSNGTVFILVWKRVAVGVGTSNRHSQILFIYSTTLITYCSLLYLFMYGSIINDAFYHRILAWLSAVIIINSYTHYNCTILVLRRTALLLRRFFFSLVGSMEKDEFKNCLFLAEILFQYLSAIFLIILWNGRHFKILSSVQIKWMPN